MERRQLPVALLAAAAGVAITRPQSAAAQTVTHGTLLGPPLILTGAGVYTPSAGAAAIYVVLIGGGGGSGGGSVHFSRIRKRRRRWRRGMREVYFPRGE